jgi:hypothetical protein
MVGRFGGEIQFKKQHANFGPYLTLTNCFFILCYKFNFTTKYQMIEFCELIKSEQNYSTVT